MITDHYTKSMLTVIAGALLWLCLDTAVHPRMVSAQGEQRVVITGIEIVRGRGTGEIPVKLIGGAKYGNLEIDKDNPVPVEVESK
jgi:hypothetical protein